MADMPEMVFLDVGGGVQEVRFLCPRCRAVMDCEALETTTLGDARPTYAPGVGTCPTEGCGTTCVSCHRRPGEVHGPHCWDRMRDKVSDPHIVDDSDCKVVMVRGVGFAGWDHGVWRAVAVMLAEPLRKAFDAHLDAHRCGDPYVGIGFAYCREAMELWDLLPDGDRIVIA